MASLTRYSRNTGPVAAARERRAPGALELDVASRTAAIERISDENRAPITELRHKVAELMARVGHCNGRKLRRQLVAREDRGQRFAVSVTRVETQFARQGAIELNQARLGDRGGGQPRIEIFGQARVCARQ
jgi:hypothetical protein